jgi:hypothetical protein
MIRKGIRSTNKPTINEIMDEEIDTEPKLDPPRHITNRQHYVGVTTIAFEDLKGIIATDLPGKSTFELLRIRFDITKKTTSRFISMPPV